MPQNERNRGFRRSEIERGGRVSGEMDRDRYASGYERRYSPSWDEDTNSGGFEGDRSSSAGGYAEEFGARQRGSRDWARGHGQRGGDYGTQSDWNRESGDRWEGDFRQRSARDEARYSRDASPSRWHEDGFNRRRTGRGEAHLMRWDDRAGESGSYFGTGSYYGAYGTQPGSSASGSAYGESDSFGTGENPRRAWDDEESYGPSSGDYPMYGRSQFGAQSGYGRDYGRSSQSQRGFGQDFRERFAEERYGREPEYGYGFGQGPYKREVGEFRGRGPKGYERSDERLREIICERLTDEPSVDASDVSIEVKDKVVKLTGHVSDRRTKYEIEDLVEHCGGVKDIDNQIRVRTGFGMTQSSGAHVRTNDQPSSSTGTSTAGQKSGQSKRS